MIGVGVIGLGFMGRMHLGALQKVDGARIAAISDRDESRARGDLSGGWGNLEGGIEKLDMGGIHGTTDWRELIALDSVDIVDLCLPTPAHEEVALAALAAGKHVLCEKPLALDVASAQRIADAAEASGKLFMPAMVLRFCPEYVWLKKAIDEKTHGAVLSARFTRLTGPPVGWFLDGELSGGAILDLHIHDADFVYHLFGMPQSVSAHGYSSRSGKVDHVVAQYRYGGPGAPPMVQAEGGWLGEGYPFGAGFIVHFERATVDFEIGRDPALRLVQGDSVQAIPVSGDGYANELAYFVRCVAEGRSPQTVTARDAVASLRLIEAERQSVETGQVVDL